MIMSSWPPTVLVDPAPAESEARELGTLFRTLGEWKEGGVCTRIVENQRIPIYPNDVAHHREDHFLGDVGELEDVYSCEEHAVAGSIEHSNGVLPAPATSPAVEPSMRVRLPQPRMAWLS